MKGLAKLTARHAAPAPQPYCPGCLYLWVARMEDRMHERCLDVLREIMRS